MHEFSPARLAVATDLPSGSGWVYEPKFDGYRCTLGKDAEGRPFGLSRNGKDLGRYFPELRRLAEGLHEGSLLDGEAVKPTPEGVSFLGSSAGSCCRFGTGPRRRGGRRPRCWPSTCCPTGARTCGRCG